MLLLARPLPVESLNASATSPRAVFSAATVLKKSAELPKALLPNPSVLVKSALLPTASLKLAVGRSSITLMAVRTQAWVQG